MNYLSIDALIVSGFLLLTLLVGLWPGKGIKDIHEYAIANKMYGTGVLTMTILATYITASNMIGAGLVAGIMGLKTDARSFFVALLVTSVTFVLVKMYFSNYFLMPASILVNGISFFITHLIQNRGFVLVKRQNS
jgi:Na+/proline symporter